MPRGDRTGPNGLGPMTGRGLGYCAGYNTPGYTKGPGMGLGRGGGRGFGRGRGPGFGRGYRFRGNYGAPLTPYYAPPPVYDYPAAPAQPLSKEQQVTMLKQEKDYLTSELEGIKKAMDDINKSIEKLESE